MQLEPCCVFDNERTRDVITLAVEPLMKIELDWLKLTGCRSIFNRGGE